MTYFTDSAFERMMQEVPHSSTREEIAPSVLPENEPCRSCPYKSPVCIGMFCKQKRTAEQEMRHE